MADWEQFGIDDIGNNNGNGSTKNEAGSDSVGQSQSPGAPLNVVQSESGVRRGFQGATSKKAQVKPLNMAKF